MLHVITISKLLKNISVICLLTLRVNDDIIDSQGQSKGVDNMQETEKFTTNEVFQKFLALPEEKQERIINAAMNEFLSGYKNASTDNIVKKAGISKGLLFHYFGTKEQLYNFLIDYSISIMQREYFDLINILQPDILESVWQLSLLKQDLSAQYPAIFDFMTCAFVDASTKNESTAANLARFNAIQADIMAKVYAHADTSLFREDINPKTAIEIITWTLHGYAQSKVNIATTPGESIGTTARENFGEFLEEFQLILNTLRKCIYKEDSQ